MKALWLLPVVPALLIGRPAGATGDSERLEQMWQADRIIPPGVYHLDRPARFNVSGIRVLHLEGVVFDGTALPGDAPYLTLFCSAMRLQHIVGGSWERGAHRVAVEVNRNACAQVRDMR